VVFVSNVTLCVDSEIKAAREFLAKLDDAQYTVYYKIFDRTIQSKEKIKFVYVKKRSWVGRIVTWLEERSLKKAGFVTGGADGRITSIFKSVIRTSLDKRNNVPLTIEPLIDVWNKIQNKFMGFCENKISVIEEKEGEEEQRIMTQRAEILQAVRMFPPQSSNVHNGRSAPWAFFRWDRRAERWIVIQYRPGIVESIATQLGKAAAAVFLYVDNKRGIMDPKKWTAPQGCRSLTDPNNMAA
jgi:hypothetical protein